MAPNPPRIAIVFWSKYGHQYQMAQQVAAGIKEAGGNVDIYRIKEDDASASSHTAAWASVPQIDPAGLSANYDAFLMGIPTRYGNMPAQWRLFWDSAGPQWAKGAFYGKYAGLFLSTSSFGGGQESTALASMSTLAHHGIVYVPLGYAGDFGLMADISEVRGGGPWGAGTYAPSEGKRDITEKEEKVMRLQGREFYKRVAKVDFT